MIRSAKLSIKFANIGKQENLKKFLAEYCRVCAAFIDILWEKEKIPILLPIEITSKIETWLSARMKQAAGKQASAIVRGTRKKQAKRLYMIKKLMSEGQTPKKLQRIYEKTIITKPNLLEIQPELDSRFIKINSGKGTSFDLWLNIGSIGNKQKIKIPLKKSRSFNKWASVGILKKGTRLSSKEVTFMFEIKDPEKKIEGKSIGLDIGEKSVFYCSDGQNSQKDLHGWTLDKIIKKLAKKKRGSRAFKKAQAHRKNYINWSLNQLDLSKTKELRIEDISKLRYKNHSSRRLSHWTYTEIFGKIEKLCEETGVHISRRDPTYTSQRCSLCGWVRKANRKGKLFVCDRCKMRTDADLNSSRNLQLILPRIPTAIRRKELNRKGFYWLPKGIFSNDGEELFAEEKRNEAKNIVPLAQKPKDKIRIKI